MLAVIKRVSRRKRTQSETLTKLNERETVLADHDGEAGAAVATGLPPPPATAAHIAQDTINRGTVRHSSPIAHASPNPIP